MNVEKLAREAAGNWQKFDSFSWHRESELDDSENWCLVYTNNRDSGLLAQSNAFAIAKEMEEFTEGDDPDCVAESHSHWACGWIEGYSLRVYKNGQITPAFKKWCEIQESLEDYPVLDESDYSQREYEATCENIKDEGIRVARKHDLELPDGFESEVFSWFWDHKQNAVENRDDQGGYPSEEDLLEAFEGLGYRTEAENDFQRTRYGEWEHPAKDQQYLY